MSRALGDLVRRSDKPCHRLWSTTSCSIALPVILCLTSAIQVTDAGAGEIGSANPIGWTGTYAGIRHGPSDMEDDNDWWAFVVEDDHRGVSNSVSEVPDQGDGDFYDASHDVNGGGVIRAYARTQPYGFSGFSSARNWYQNAFGFPFNSVQTGGFFRDELYFETVDGAPGSLEFDFHVSFSLELLEDWDTEEVPAGSYAEFQMNVLGYTGEGPAGPAFESLDTFELRLDAGGDEHLAYDDTVTIATNANGHLLRSGNYIPLSFTKWTYANNGEIDWMNTVTLEDVRVYDAEGNLLGPQQYTLRSPNDQYFGFQNEVPEPGSALLFGVGLLGLIGIGWCRSRQK
ncbi:MAG: PEP-CTERM sorting domain-containing protein [Pirellulaceae bacterium]|jgi:hypothetical protein|nr:PEP-CTERM sorting domain-containing protein [Pirellulaceae bacterium]